MTTGGNVTRGETVFLPELQEQDAPPDIRAIYEEIRRLTGVPMVALIWRHLATLPGVLPDAWSSVAPVLRSGLLQETAWQISADARIPQLTPLTGTALTRLGVDTAARGAIASVLEAYNRANPVNMLCVYALFARLMRPDGQALAPDVVLWEAPPPVGPLPPMFAPAEMEPRLRGKLESLASPEAATGAPVIPSLYRHLVPWPGYIDWLETAVRPCLDDGAIGQAVTSIRTSMAREAEELVVHVPPALALQAHPAAKTALTRFSSLIPEMIVIGRLLHEAMPPQGA
jgi:hypothetical protein